MKHPCHWHKHLKHKANSPPFTNQSCNALKWKRSPVFQLFWKHTQQSCSTDVSSGKMLTMHNTRHTLGQMAATNWLPQNPCSVSKKIHAMHLLFMLNHKIISEWRCDCSWTMLLITFANMTQCCLRHWQSKHWLKQTVAMHEFLQWQMRTMATWTCEIVLNLLLSVLWLHCIAPFLDLDSSNWTQQHDAKHQFVIFLFAIWTWKNVMLWSNRVNSDPFPISFSFEGVDKSNWTHLRVANSMKTIPSPSGKNVTCLLG